MKNPTEKQIKKFAKGYERRGGTSAYYLAGGDFENFLSELIATFKGIYIGIRTDRGQGLLLSVMSTDQRATLYSVRVRNTNARGVARTPVRYSFTIENRDINLEFC